MIGAILPTYKGAFFSAMLEGMELGAVRAGYKLVPTFIPMERVGERQFLDVLLRYRPDGVIAMTHAMEWKRSIYDVLLRENVPLLGVGRKFDIPGVNSIYADEELGGYLATKCLIENGHRHILHARIPYGGHESSSADRVNGYRKALREADIPFRKDYIVTTPIENAGEAMLEKLMTCPRITAAFACPDDLAARFLVKAEATGVLIPDRVSLVGYGDNFFYPELMKTPLTTIDQNSYEMGKRAVRKLIAIINDEDDRRDEMVMARLIERNSVKRLST